MSDDDNGILWEYKYKKLSALYNHALYIYGELSIRNMYLEKENVRNTDLMMENFELKRINRGLNMYNDNLKALMKANMKNVEPLPLNLGDIFY